MTGAAGGRRRGGGADEEQQGNKEYLNQGYGDGSKGGILSGYDGLTMYVPYSERCVGMIASPRGCACLALGTLSQAGQGSGRETGGTYKARRC